MKIREMDFSWLSCGNSIIVFLRILIHLTESNDARRAGFFHVEFNPWDWRYSQISVFSHLASGNAGGGTNITWGCGGIECIYGLNSLVVVKVFFGFWG